MLHESDDLHRNTRHFGENFCQEYNIIILKKFICCDHAYLPKKFDHSLANM